MNRLLLFAGVLLMLMPACASAETWVNEGSHQYDADSVFIDPNSGLLHYTLCMEDKCVAGNTDQLTMFVRYDCGTRMESNYDPFGQTWIQPTEHKVQPGDLESKLCARRASLPRHQ
jgi:hypothetical protein